MWLDFHVVVGGRIFTSAPLKNRIWRVVRFLRGG